MFSIEHDFDETVITLIDEGDDALQEDVTIRAGDEGVVLEQPLADDTDEVARITLSQAQLRDLVAALDLPEGVYRRHKKAPRT
jgi:hypothetical protein